jgi:hypothetical protein
MERNMPKFDQITVRINIRGPAGNAFTIMGIVSNAMREHRIEQAEIDAYRRTAMLGDYQDLLRITRETVNFNP